MKQVHLSTTQLLAANCECGANLFFYTPFSRDSPLADGALIPLDGPSFCQKCGSRVPEIAVRFGIEVT